MRRIDELHLRLMSSISGGAEAAASPDDRQCRGLICGAFSRRWLQNSEPELLPPTGETALRERRLTKSEEEESMIINRSGRSSYPERKALEEAEAPINPRSATGHDGES